MSTATLLWGMIFSAIGVGYFIYGKRQAALVPLLCGVALVAYPWFVSNALLTVLIGVALLAIPWLAGKV